MSADQTVEIPNQPGLNIDLTRMREAALHAQVHGAVFKANGSQVRQVLDYLHERTVEIKRLNARIAELEAQLAQPSREQINKWLEVHKLMTIDPDVWRAAQQERKPLADEQIQQIDDETPFHESPGWSLRFARNVLAARAKQQVSDT